MDITSLKYNRCLVIDLLHSFNARCMSTSSDFWPSIILHRFWFMYGIKGIFWSVESELHWKVKQWNKWCFRHYRAVKYRFDNDYVFLFAIDRLFILLCWVTSCQLLVLCVRDNTDYFRLGSLFEQWELCRPTL